MEKKKPMVGIWDVYVKHMFESSLIIFFIIGALATTAVYYVNSDEQETSLQPAVRKSFVYDDSLDGCDLFSGKWVHDNNSYPLYKELECPYIPGEFACGQHGRMDSMYQQWRWKPHGCNLPRSHLSLSICVCLTYSAKC